MPLRSYIHTSFYRSSVAFTLLELLVSMTLLSLLLVVLMSMVDNSTKLWRQSENRVDSYREARGAVNTITADLASIMPSTDLKFFQCNTIADLPDSIEKSPEYSHLFFLTSQPAESQDLTANKSDLCLVGYYIAYSKASINSEMPSLNLYRYFQSSDTTFEKSIKTASSDSLIPASLPPSPQPSTGDELLARNVTRFKIRAYTSTGEEILSNGTTKAPNLVNFKQENTKPMPNIIEIELTVVNNETAKRLTTLSAWKDSKSSIQAQNARTFTARVRLSTDSAISAVPSL